MNIRIQHTLWTDPDTAPELTDSFFENAQPFVNSKPVSSVEFNQALEVRKTKPSQSEIASR